ncbi:hypothetical protein [Streptomyces sp. NPDC053367]
MAVGFGEAGHEGEAALCSTAVLVEALTGSTWPRLSERTTAHRPG